MSFETLKQKTRSIRNRAQLVKNAITKSSHELNPMFRVLENQSPLFIDYLPHFEPRYGHGKSPHPLLFQQINSFRQDYTSLFKSFLSFRDEWSNIPLTPGLASAPYWHNPFFSGLDALSIYSLIRLKQPRYFFEVGSGFSTRFARQAINRNTSWGEIICVDPEPRSEIRALADKNIAKPLEQINLDEFNCLNPGDILFIDNSHRCLMNSDVTVFFLEVLPRIKPGVLIGIHDIFLPFDYPPEWQDRFYSEQYLLAAFLLASSDYVPRFPNYFITQDKELRTLINVEFKAGLLSQVELQGCAFWFEKTGLNN